MNSTYELAIKYDQAEITNNKILLEQCNDEMKYLTADEKEQVKSWKVYFKITSTFGSNKTLN